MQVRQEILDVLKPIKDELMTPFQGLIGMADAFIAKYAKVFNLIKNVKEAYTMLKEGWVQHQFTIMIYDGITCIKKRYGFACYKDVVTV